ncbi:hypothetical protein [Paraburkholderia dipogonis]|uniref:hypothetical protein n=1 Tax=Paraburkholderia dipogonis TaxID=1211383 RepID=UPI0038BA2530
MSDCIERFVEPLFAANQLGKVNRRERMRGPRTSDGCLLGTRMQRSQLALAMKAAADLLSDVPGRRQTTSI